MYSNRCMAVRNRTAPWLMSCATPQVTGVFATPLATAFLHLPLSMSCVPSAPPTPSSDPLGQALASIGRIGVSPIQSPEKMRAVLSGLALDLADLRDQLHREKHPQWWRLADAVDEVLDVYESQFGPLPPASPAT